MALEAIAGDREVSRPVVRVQCVSGDLADDYVVPSWGLVVGDGRGNSGAKQPELRPDWICGFSCRA